MDNKVPKPTLPKENLHDYKISEDASSKHNHSALQD
jgi:hypothetical protein